MTSIFIYAGQKIDKKDSYPETSGSMNASQLPVWTLRTMLVSYFETCSAEQPIKEEGPMRHYQFLLLTLFACSTSSVRQTPEPTPQTLATQTTPSTAATPTNEPKPALTDLRTVWGTDENNIFIGGANGVAFHVTNQGNKWRSLHAPPGINCESVLQVNNSLLLSGSSKERGGDIILISKDDGASWKGTFQGFSSVDNLWSDEKNIYGVFDGGILQSTDEGKTWGEGKNPKKYVTFFGSFGGIWFSGANREIYLSDNKGKSWSKARLNTFEEDENYSEFVSGVWGNTTDGFFAVGSNGSSVSSRDGKKWSEMNNPFAKGEQIELHSVFGVHHPDGSFEVYAVGNMKQTEGIILQSKNGAAWNQKKIPQVGSLKSVFASGEFVYAVGASGVLLSSNRGETWQ